MKRFLLTLLLALSLGIGAAWAETASISFNSTGLNVSSLDLDDFINISIIKDKGSTAPNPQTSHVRFYGGNKMTISAKDAIISQVVFTTESKNPFKDAAAATTGTLTINSNTKTTWKPANADDQISSFSISNGTSGSTGQIRIASIEVTYESTSSLQNPNLSYPSQTVNVNLGEVVVNELENPYNVSVVYDSSNKEVATVNLDGSITVLDAGKTVISATSQKDDTYMAGYASYTLVVKDPNAKPYKLVTSVDELYDGAKAIIVSAAKGDAMSVTQNSNNRGVAPVTIIDNEVTPSDDVAIVRINIVNGNYTLYVTNGESTGYLYHPSSKNYLRTQDDAAEASISFSGNDVLIEFDGSYKIRRNSSSSMYSCYTSAQTPIQLYVIPSNLKDASISFDSQSYETVEGEIFNNALLSGVPEGADVSYVSSDATIASVDASTGEVTAIKGGKVTITATSSATSEYKAGTASYELVIKKVGIPDISPLTAEVEEDGFLTVGPADFIADVKNFSITSSNEDVFDVAYDGTECTFLAYSEGTVTLTVTWDAGDIYAAGSKDFEFTVTPLGSLAAPVFEPESGTYEVTEVVSISGPAGATIYYGVGTTKADATDVYTEEFMLETLGEVTYVAYAKKDDRESDIVTVTYNVVKETAVFEFNAAAGETAMGSLLDIDALLNNPKALEYTLSTDNAEVARVAINDPKHIWLMGAGVVNITATPVSTDYTATATTYALSVKEEVGEPVETTATFDFTKAGAYGMVAQSGTSSTYNETKTEPSKTYTHENGEVQFVTSSKVSGGNFSGTRLWGTKEPYEYRVTSNLTLTISASGYILNSVTYVSDKTEKNAELSDDKTSAIISSGNSTLKISSITVNYTKPGEPAHCYANLSMGDEREALIDATTIVDAATVENDATALVEYVVLDENGAVSEEVEAVAIDGKLEITTIGNNEGDYTILAYIDPYNEANAKYYAQVVEVPLHVRSMITPAELYIHGHFYNRYYDLTNPVKMEKNGRVFTATDVLIGGNEEHADDNFDFVFSSHKLDLAEAPEQSMMRAAAAAGSHQWAALTEGYVYHAASGNALTVTPASEITEAAHITPIYDGDDAKGKAGIYQFSVDFSNAAVPTYVAEYTGDITTGVEGIVVDNDAEAVYYDLTGRRVLNPSAGVVIRVQGGKAEKIMIK